jgi:hypothetical protein
MKSVVVYGMIFGLIIAACFVFVSQAKAEPDEQDLNSIPLGSEDGNDVFDDLPEPLVKTKKSKTPAAKPVVKAKNNKLLPFCNKTEKSLCVPRTDKACFCAVSE